MAAPEFSTTTELKSRQTKIALVIGLLIVGVLMFFLYNNANKAQTPASQNPDHVVKESFTTPRKAVNAEEAWITQSEVDLKSMARRMNELERDNQVLRQQVEQFVDEKSQVVSPGDEPGSVSTPPKRRLLPPLGKPPPPTRSIDKPASRPSSTRTGLQKLAGAQEVQSKIVRVAFAKTTGSDELTHAHINETLPAGTFVNAVMLNGLAAPTGNLGQRNPHPILLELVDMGNLPNRFTHRVKSCRIIAAGHGELSDERAYLRLERMTCVLRTGEVISKEAQGYITGEDGKNGMAGLLVTKQGAFVARALLAGVFSGLGQAIGQSYTNVSTSALGSVETIDPADVGRAGVAQGVSNASEKVADWYLERADEVFPFIEIEAGRIVTVTFTHDIDLGANVIAKHTQ